MRGEGLLPKRAVPIDGQGGCRDDGTGKLSCVEPPQNQCSKVGEKCVTAADCCGNPDVQCDSGFCAAGKN